MENTSKELVNQKLREHVRFAQLQERNKDSCNRYNRNLPIRQEKERQENQMFQQRINRTQSTKQNKSNTKLNNNLNNANDQQQQNMVMQQQASSTGVIYLTFQLLEVKTNILKNFKTILGSALKVA